MSNDPHAFSQTVDGMEPNGEEEESFDFTEHRRTAVEEYRRIRGRYEAFAQAVREILVQALRVAEIRVNSVEARAKDPESFGAKTELPSDSDHRVPKYKCPLRDITDLAGVRIIAFFPRTVESIGDCIRKEFDVIEHTDHSQRLLEQEQFGYQSEHYLVKLSGRRTALPEYEPHRGLVAEVQVRTILQHAWAEIEHDIQYKTSITTPDTIRRRFMSLAGLLEIADREFQAIQDEDKELKHRARTSVEQGTLNEVEITADALRSYLDRKVGPDGRSTDFSYDYTARILRRLGFTSFDQVECCIKDYDGDQLSRVLLRQRQGSITRFEHMLLAGMGDFYVERMTNDEEWREALRRTLAKFEQHGIKIGNYDPISQLAESLPTDRIPDTGLLPTAIYC